MIIEIRRYCQRTGSDPRFVVNSALGYSKAYEKLVNGAEWKEETIEKLRAFMADHPDGVRPQKCGRKPKSELS